MPQSFPFTGFLREKCFHEILPRAYRDIPEGNEEENKEGRVKERTREERRKEGGKKKERES